MLNTLVDALAAYARLAHTLRISRIGPGSFWSDLPLTLPQLKTLGIIASAGPAGRSGRDLATYLGVGASAVTPLVDRLVEHGYATRHEDAVDRRILRVRVTPSGLGLLQRLDTVRREELTEIVSRIDATNLPVVERAMAILIAAAEQVVADQSALPVATVSS